MKLKVLVFTFLSTLTLPAFAEVRIITATGEYRMGDYDTRVDAKHIALQDAKRIALEQAGTYIESIVQVKDLSLTKDEIQAYAAGIVEVMQQRATSRMEGQQQIMRVEVTCRIDTDVVVRQMDSLLHNEAMKSELMKSKHETNRLRQNLEDRTRELSAARSEAEAKRITETRRLYLTKQQIRTLTTQALFVLFADNKTLTHGSFSPQSLKRAKLLTMQALTLDPFDVGVHMLLGLLLAERGNLEETVAAYRRAARAKPNDADISYFRGLAAFAEETPKSYGRAVAEFRKVIRLRPNDANAHYMLGTTLKCCSSDRSGAAAEYRMAIKLNPNFVDAHTKLGMALAEGVSAKDADEAIAAFQTAIRLEPDSMPEVHYHLGLLLFRHKEDIDGAITELSTSLRLQPIAPAVHQLLGAALQKKGDLEGAIAAYRAAIESDTYTTISGSIYKDLGLALQAKGELQEAIAAFRKAVDLNPSVSTYHYNLGIALHTTNDFTGAIAAYRAAIQNATWFYADAHFGLAAALQADGRRSEAAQEFREFVSRALDVPENGSRIEQAREALRELE